MVQRNSRDASHLTTLDRLGVDLDECELMEAPEDGPCRAGGKSLATHKSPSGDGVKR